MNAGAYANMSGAQIRALCRHNRFDRSTAGVAIGYAQVNLVILPAEAAREFEAFCRANPKPCPLLEITVPGDYEPKWMAPGGDVRTDLPRYRVLKNGECVDRPTSIAAYCPGAAQGRRSDLVAFLIGCSFTFEAALLRAGVPVRHIEEGKNVPMYRTSIACTPAGRFQGPMVVSMRPMSPRHVECATRITAAFARVHGAPIHVGNARELGIADLAVPDYGDAVTLRPGEVPVFWACGVTPMEAILQARPEIAITHEPGHMLVTDVPDESFRNGEHRNGAR